MELAVPVYLGVYFMSEPVGQSLKRTPNITAVVNAQNAIATGPKPHLNAA